MILLSESVEPTVSKATSTYPAVITSVSEQSNSNNDLTRTISFYCPSTMGSNVWVAAYSSLYNNVLEVPVRLHEGAQEFNYQIGGVIVISFEDGNLNSPQFVRFVNVSESVISQNKQFLNGVIIQENAILNLNDTYTLDSDILKKAKTLLPYISTCSIGDQRNETTYVYEFLNSNPFINVFRFGPYGIELMKKDKNTNVGYTLEYDGTNENDKVEVPRITFFDLCARWFNYVGTNSNIPAATEITEFLQNLFVEKYSSSFTDNYSLKDDNIALCCLANLSGYVLNGMNLGTSGNLITGKIDEKSIISICSKINSKQARSEDFINAVKEKLPLSYSGTAYPDAAQFLSSFYTTTTITNNNVVDVETLRKWRNALLGKISEKYSIEVDRYIAIKAHNNLFDLKNYAGLDNVNNLLLLVTACVITAYPLIETVFRLGIEKFKALGMPNVILVFVEKLNEDIKSNRYTSGTELIKKAKYFADCFARTYVYLLCKDKYDLMLKSELYKVVKSHIELGINKIANNSQSLLSVMQQDLYNYNSNTVNPATGQNYSSETTTGGLVHGYIWPVPGYYHITSLFGPRWERYHNGIDIGAPKGTYALAAADGIVIFASYDGGAGNHIKIKHNDGYITEYMHLLQFNVSVGNNVKKGQVIGRIDNTGSSQGDHLHFGIIVPSGIRGEGDGNRYLNPMGNIYRTDARPEYTVKY